MAMLSHAAPRGAFAIVLLAALFAFVADADAKGKRSSSSSSKSTSSSKPKEKEDESSITLPRVSIRSGSSSTSTSTSAAAGGALGSNLVPIDREPTQLEKEDADKRAVQMAAYERDQAQKMAERRAAAERAEAERIAAEQAAQARAAQKAAEQKAAEDKLAAAEAQKKRDAAAVTADVDRVLQRAKTDYPILGTAEGASLLQSIMDRQKLLAARGMYPSVAMVEAVADHREALTPRMKREPVAMQPESAATAQSEQAAKAYGNCRWVTPYQWSCK